ncbi:MAG TPA: sensor histidine kinase [Thermoanaerobaculia bacterium]
MSRHGEPSKTVGLSAESLRWAMGLLCALLGALILIAPHRFAAPPYESLAQYREVWGVAALASGVALLAVAVLRPRRRTSFPAHLLAGITLLALAASFAQSGIWVATAAYVLLGLGTAASGLISTRPGAAPDLRPELFPLLMSIIAAINGLTLVAWPDLSRASYFDPSRPALPALGAALLAGGVLLGAAQLWRGASRYFIIAAHLAAGAAFFAFGTVVSLRQHAWTALAVNSGYAFALALLPWISPRLARLNTSTLRTRLALVLATATSLALILTAAVATRQEERLAVRQVIATRQIEATAIAQNVTDYVELIAARTSTIAARAGHVPLEPAAQRGFLARTLPAYPEVAGLLSLDGDGRVLATTGAVPLNTVDWRDLAAGARNNPRVGVQLLDLPGEEVPVLLLSAPIVGPEGNPRGVLVSVLGPDALARRIERPGSDVHLADGYGRDIARVERLKEGLGATPLPDGWDARVRQGQPLPTTRALAAFAPVPGLGWAVAVERPRSVALSGVRQGRDMAFLLLLLVIPLAVVGGIFAARRIARPLGTLSEAVGELAAGNLEAPLERSDITEVEKLSAAFAEMRDRLAARTRESERLAGELRARAEALADSDRRKDEFLAMLAHELRNPLGAIANSAYVLRQLGPEQPQMERAVAVIQRQIQHLVRLVDDLLDVSRITRGKVTLKKESADLREVVRHAIEMTRPLVEAKSHELRVALPPEPLPLVADVTRLEQVVGNLLRNAAKYTEPRGEIAVVALAEGGEAVLRVRDNGVGIQPELLPRVFDLFIQGEQTLDRSGAGLGIGLTLVRSLVEMHGGRVEARSEGKGRGAEFVVRLPMSPSRR